MLAEILVAPSGRRVGKQFPLYVADVAGTY